MDLKVYDSVQVLRGADKFVFRTYTRISNGKNLLELSDWTLKREKGEHNYSFEITEGDLDVSEPGE